MNPIRRELLNGLFVLVVASLLSVAFAAFQVSFNVQLWVLILIGVAVAVSGYVMFETTLGYLASTDAREKAWEESTRRREEEWLKRVGNPARFSITREGITPDVVDTVRAVKPGTDLTFMMYISPEGGSERAISEEGRERLYSAIIEQVKRGTVREYKRLFCFDHGVLENNPELKSGILRVGEGPGTITRVMGEHCRQMMQTKGCSLYIAPMVLRSIVAFYGADTVSMTVETAEQDTGVRTFAGIMFFYDPPNGEIIEQFRQFERATERRMVAVHKIRFPEDAEPTVAVATR
jgi:hypothetical protein